MSTNNEKKFEIITGIDLSTFNKELEIHYQYIDKLINNAMDKYHPTLSISDDSRKYFHDLFGFSFNINRIIEEYIDSIISSPNTGRVDDEIAYGEQNYIEIENLIDPSPQIPSQNINYNLLIGHSFDFPEEYELASKNFQIFKKDF